MQCSPHQRVQAAHGGFAVGPLAPTFPRGYAENSVRIYAASQPFQNAGALVVREARALGDIPPHFDPRGGLIHVLPTGTAGTAGLEAQFSFRDGECHGKGT